MTPRQSLRDRLLHLLSDRGPRLLRDLASLASGQLFSMVVGFVAFAYLARVLDPVSYGAVEYAIGLAVFFAIIVECGLGPIGVREVARDPAQTPGLAAQIPGARVWLALICVPLVGLAGALTTEEPEVSVLVWLFALSIFAIPFKQDWLLQSLERMNLAAAAQPVRMAVFALGAFLLVRNADDLLAVGYVEIAAAAAMALYYVIAQIASGVPLRINLSPLASWRLVREGAAVGLSTMVWAFMQYAPLFLVAWLVGGEERAWLGSSQRIVLALLTFSFVYYFNLYPVIARHLSGDRAEWRRLMQASVRLVAWSTFGLALVLALLSETLMTLVFGAQFIAAAPAFAILVWTLPIRLLSGHARWALIASGRQRYLLFAELIGAGALLIGGLVLIPLYDSAGAAIAAVVGNLVGWVAAHLFVLRLVDRLPSFWQALAPGAAALAAGAAVWLLLPNPFAAAAVGLAGYLACAAFVGAGLFADLKRLAYAKADLAAENRSS